MSCGMNNCRKPTRTGERKGKKRPGTKENTIVKDKKADRETKGGEIGPKTVFEV